jgi:hypothetical protein
MFLDYIKNLRFLSIKINKKSKKKKSFFIIATIITRLEKDFLKVINFYVFVSKMIIQIERLFINLYIESPYFEIIIILF